MGLIKAWEQEEGIRPDFKQLYARTPSTHRCDGYLERLALWKQRIHGIYVHNKK